MGAQLTYGTAGATGGGYSAQPGTIQHTYGDPCADVRWDMQARAPKTWSDPYRWSSLWPTMRVGIIAGGDGWGTGGNATVYSEAFEPFSCDGPGTQSIKFVLGQCVDASDNPVADASVMAFVSSTDAFAGEGVSRADGSYAAPTQNPGVAHYIVAYKAGSPDIAGTTVNTLIPTNLDGT